MESKLSGESYLRKYSTATVKVVKEEVLSPSTYGGRHLVTMLPGVGSGPRLMEYVKDIFKAAYVPVDFEVIEVKSENHQEKDDRMMVSSLLRNRVGIKGHIPSLADTSSNVTLRSHLDLFVYLVHCKSYPNVRCKYPNLDIFLFRQNTEGEYAMLEHELKYGVVESLKIITRKNTERFARWALEFIKREKRKRMTIVHKANIMKLSDGLFLKTVMNVAKQYPEVKVDHLIVDNCCMQIVSKPETFDVLIMPNLYGNVITNILCGLVGGPGLISGQNYGESMAVFEVASRLTSYEDESIANPIGMLNAAINMLYYLKKNSHAELIRNAIRKTLVLERIHTPDIGGNNTSDEMVESIKKQIERDFIESALPIF
ncbi:isocitrate dehydrogenase [NAD] subunit gamma, mitochondrial-like [Anoplophora glabripennis]|uniref:isocitrate dehydrogenase [NAD] subunit gamma, mitochondrial-like n=1 Tax=Anoplophora glabripennis TaxID=217634 RepID=UPI0008753E06|nr:isocitrate dehydrogenase [NAD] subunit gamma, mitochondrial-like [Anoplophora glabripennis]